MNPTVQFSSSTSSMTQKKWLISIFSGLIFLLLSSPMLYKLTDSVTECIGFSLASSKGCPSMIGLLVHTIVFVLIVRFLMK